MKINNYINKFFLLMAGVTLLSSGCSDAPDELTEVTFDRVFSVNEDNITVNVTNKTTLRLTYDKVRNADSYTIELFANDADKSFTGTPSATLEKIEYASPLLIEGLEGETAYSGRIKGISDTPDISDSKWVEFSFETDAENIFNAIGDGLGAITITLSWPAGSAVTHIIVRDSEGKEIRHNLTDSEISTGSATVEGLSGDTSYSATIYNSAKARGTVSFVTNPDLGDAIQVNPGDNLAELIANADDEASFALMPGRHQVHGTVTVNKNISIIAAYATNKPIIEGAVFNIDANIDLALKNLILEGTYTNADGVSTQVNTVFSTKAGLNIGDISVESCEITTYGRGFIAIASGVALSINSFIVDDCIMHDGNITGNDTFDLRGGMCKNLRVTNSTFYNFGARDFIRADNESYGAYGGSMNVTIDHCTFNGISNSTSYAILYIRYTNSTCRVSNCIFTNTIGALERSKPSSVTISYSRNNYFNAENAVKNDPTGTTYDPQYADAANGDFTVGQEDLYFAGTGDPRWIK